jgi:hypothetical protein
MCIPVWGYRNVEHYLYPMKKDSTQRTAVFREKVKMWQNITVHQKEVMNKCGLCSTDLP